MTALGHPGVVAVIIAARNARGTIARAVGCALSETVVGEVVVVDDASTDDTAAVARSADDGSDRLQVLHLPHNLGPSAARNRAIRASTAPYLAVLDADDYWRPGRVQRLVAEIRDHDFVADDLLRVVEGREGESPTRLIGDAMPLPCELTLAEFALRSVSRRGRPGQELGLLKPLMRRSFLQEQQLAYDEKLRLGEGFILYAQALARGARFRLIPPCGYYAVERPDSIGACPGAAEVAAKAKAVDALFAEPGLTAKDRSALAAARREVRSRLHFHRVLQARRTRGLAQALGVMVTDPSGAAYVLSEAIAARLQRFRGKRAIAEAVY